MSRAEITCPAKDTSEFYSKSLIGLMSRKYAIVQLPRMMKVVATQLETARVDIPVSPCPMLQPPPIWAPIPIMTPPRSTLSSSSAGGTFNLTSFKSLPLRYAPKGTAST